MKNILRFRTYYKRNLPHIQIENSFYAITFRLAFSIPKEILKKLGDLRKDFDGISKVLKGKELKDYKQEFERRYFEDFDRFIEGFVASPKWLSKNEIAEIVLNSVQFFNNKRYVLYAICIMPNHVHMIIQPLESESGDFYSLAEIMHSIKSFSAGECNKILQRKGQFWYHESYDHLIRNEEDFFYQMNYIINNPVKSGLIDDAYKWEYLWIKEL